MDLYSAPFDYNSFDNLPLSLATPGTFQPPQFPKKLQSVSLNMIENANMRSQNFKSLVTKMEKTLKKLKGGPCLILVDNYNVLANGCYTETPELDLVEFFNSLLELAT